MTVPQTDRMELLEQLVRSYQKRLRAYLFSKTGRVDVADDLAQECFLIAFRRLSQFDSTCSAWPWLFGIARNELREHWRALGRTQAIDEIDAYMTERLLERDATDLEKGSDRSPLDALKGCLQKLAERSRDLVRMIYDERLSCTQAARALNLQAGAVRVMIHRIRKTLYACVQQTLAGRA